jgi:hypothetical protein
VAAAPASQAPTPAAAPAPASPHAAESDVALATQVLRAMLPDVSGFAPQQLVAAQDTGRVLGNVGDVRGLQLVAFRPGEIADFAVTGFVAVDGGGARLTAEQLQQTLRSGAFIDELNRLKRELREEFDMDRTTSVTVAGLSLGVSVAYVLWLVRGGVLLGSYLSALPAWRLLDPLPVLARAGEDEEDEEDDAFQPSHEEGPDPLRGFE